jgi:hypothetical protein
MRVRRRVVAIVATVMLLASLSVLGMASPANAWPWSTYVKVKGTAKCGTWPTQDNAYIVNVWTDNGESGASGTDFWGNYSVQFFKVPSGGVGAHAYVYCKGVFGVRTYQKNFTLTRPAYGETYNLDLRGG